ncbi:MAG: EAL domain-containing protein [Clostridia bacterium]|nr:EAL domain-containing protein [Clostridia bacterium]
MGNIRHHISIIASAAIMCILIIFLFAYFIVYVSSSIYQHYINSINETTAQATKTLQTTFSKDLSALEGFSFSIEHFLYNEDVLSSHLNDFFQKHDFVSVGFIDTSGNAITNDNKRFLDKNNPYLEDALQGHSGISAPFQTSLYEKNVVAVYCPVKKEDVTIGVLYGLYLPEDLYSKYYILSNYGSFYVINSAGYIILSSENENTANIFQAVGGKEHKKVYALSNSLKNNERGTSLLAVNNQKMILNYAPIKGTNGWFILFAFPYAVVSREIWSIILRSIFICVFIIICALFFVFLYAHTLKKHSEEMEKMAFSDALTGARNYTKFQMDARKLLDENPDLSYALFYTDTKNFKYINDVFGYKVGDEVLKYIAKTLRKDLNENEIFARVFADNFVVLRTYKDKSELVERFKKTSYMVSNFGPIKSKHYQIIAYTGIFCIENDFKNLSIREMCDRANLAQKSIKNSSEYYAFYTEDIRQNILSETELEKNMDSALENGEFVIYLQPKYNIKNNSLCSAEALVRWDSPGNGLIPPGKFIPLFEKNLFIISLDRFVFEEVCKKIRQWLDDGKPAIPISVNISRVQLHKQGFVNTYIQLKKDYKIPDNLIELEFTESIVYDNTDALIDIVNVLKKNGFLCSIDDFGAGYSSLNVLKELPFDILKLDGRFFKKGTSPRRDKIVVKNIVYMAKELEMKTVSEGVEEWEQVDFLRKIGCDMVQGYVYSKPIPIDVFEEKFLSQ